MSAGAAGAAALAYTYAGENSAPIAAVLGKVLAGAAAAFVERVDRVGFVTTAALAADPDPAETVRLFGPEAELRYRWDGATARWHALWIVDTGAGAVPSLPGGWDDAPVSLTREPETVLNLLWGEREHDQRFRDGRLPAAIGYPAPDGADRLAVETVRYRVGGDAVPTLSRWRALVPQPDRAA